MNALSMTELEISPVLPETSNDQRHAKWARVCVIAILSISVVYALMLPSGGLSSLGAERTGAAGYDSFHFLAGTDSIIASGSYLDISGAPQSQWPPGTSILYAAVASLSSKAPEELVMFVNLAALLLMAGSLWLIIAMTIERWWIAVITFASIFLNTSILSLQNQFLSDPLALATSSAAMASGIVACRGGKNWFSWICVGSVFLSISICIRYAMLPGIPILALAAFWLSKRSSSHRGAVFVPLLLPPLLTLISFYFVRSSGAPHLPFSIRTVNSMGSFDFAHYRYWQAFVPLADQVIPNALFATWLSIIIVGIGFIAVPLGVTFVMQKFQQRGALIICVGYVLVSCLFLALVPIISTFPFGMLYRYLLPLYPFILIGAAIAANVLLNRRRLISRILSLVIIGLLSIAAARSTRAAALGVLGHAFQHSDSCETAILDDLKRVSATQRPSAALTNIQELAWYAMRIPTAQLTWRSLADATSGTIIIFVRPGLTCPKAAQVVNITEMALTSSPDVRIVSSSGALLIGRKQ